MIIAVVISYARGTSGNLSKSAFLKRVDYLIWAEVFPANVYARNSTIRWTNYFPTIYNWQLTKIANVFDSSWAVYTCTQKKRKICVLSHPLQDLRGKRHASSRSLDSLWSTCKIARAIPCKPVPYQDWAVNSMVIYIIKVLCARTEKNPMA